MLIIRRRVGESILVGEDVEVEVLESGQGQVKLGIRAPRQVLVLRKEILAAVEENRAASASVPKEDLPGLIRALGKEMASRTAPPRR